MHTCSSCCREPMGLWSTVTEVSKQSRRGGDAVCGGGSRRGRLLPGASPGDMQPQIASQPPQVASSRCGHLLYMRSGSSLAQLWQCPSPCASAAAALALQVHGHSTCWPSDASGITAPTRGIPPTCRRATRQPRNCCLVNVASVSSSWRSQLEMSRRHQGQSGQIASSNHV